MRRFTLQILALSVLLAGCHLAAGLDDLDPGVADDDDGGAGGAGGAATASSGSGIGGTGGAGSSVTTTGGTTSTGTGATYLGPPVGNYLAGGNLASFAGPEFYVEVSTSQPDRVVLSVQFLDTQTRQLTGSPTDYDVMPNNTPGQTSLALGTVTVPGAANPVSSLPVQVDGMTLTFTSNAPPCGNLDGTITSPMTIPLAGSMFGWVSVPNASQLPSQAPTSCP